MYQDQLTRFTWVAVCKEPKLLPPRTANISTFYLVHYSSVVYILPQDNFDVQPPGTTTAATRW